MDTSDFSETEQQQANALVARGAEQQAEVPRAFWLAGHCFYIHPEKGLIEL